MTWVFPENPWDRATESIRLMYQPLEAPERVHGATAPSSRDRDLLGITRSGSTSNLYPRPVQSGQAPWGLLKLKVRGSISDRLIPHRTQANCSENTSWSFSPSRSTWTTPSPSLRAASTDSATLVVSVSGRIISRSTTISM